MVGVEPGRFVSPNVISRNGASETGLLNVLRGLNLDRNGRPFLLSGKVKLITQSGHGPGGGELVERIKHGEGLVGIQLALTEHFDGWPSAITIQFAGIQ